MYSNHLFPKKLQAVFLLSFLLMLTPPSLFAAEEQGLSTVFESLKPHAMNAYAAAKLEELERNLKEFPGKTIETSDEDESLHELIRILKTTQSHYEALNHYVFGWNTTMEYQYRANREAVQRGIKISRIFIVTEETLSSADKFHDFLNIIESQQKDGIDVFYGLQSTLEKDPEYQKFAHIDVGLSDGVVLAKVTAVSVKGPQPSNVIITWDADSIKEQNPFPYLTKSRHIKPFNELEKKKLLGMLKAGETGQ